MELTESEAKNFWPIYDQYQKELQKINQRIVGLLESYADDFRNKIADRRQGEEADRRGQRDRAGGGQSQEQLRAQAQQSAADHQSRALPANREQNSRGGEVRSRPGRAVGEVRQSVEVECRKPRLRSLRRVSDAAAVAMSGRRTLAKLSLRCFIILRQTTKFLKEEESLDVEPDSRVCRRTALRFGCRLRPDGDSPRCPGS